MSATSTWNGHTCYTLPCETIHVTSAACERLEARGYNVEHVSFGGGAIDFVGVCSTKLGTAAGKPFKLRVRVLSTLSDDVSIICDMVAPDAGYHWREDASNLYAALLNGIDANLTP